MQHVWELVYVYMYNIYVTCITLSVARIQTFYSFGLKHEILSCGVAAVKTIKKKRSGKTLVPRAAVSPLFVLTRKYEIDDTSKSSNP